MNVKFHFYQLDCVLDLFKRRRRGRESVHRRIFIYFHLFELRGFEKLYNLVTLIIREGYHNLKTV